MSLPAQLLFWVVLFNLLCLDDANWTPATMTAISTDSFGFTGSAWLYGGGTGGVDAEVVMVGSDQSSVSKVMRSTDGGVSWSTFYTTSTYPHVLLDVDLVRVTTTRYYVAVGMNGNPANSEANPGVILVCAIVGDGTCSTWTTIYKSSLLVGVKLAVSTGYAVGFSGTVLTATSNFTSWAQASSLPGSIDGTLFYSAAMYPLNASYVTIAGGGGWLSAKPRPLRGLVQRLVQTI